LPDSLAFGAVGRRAVSTLCRLQTPFGRAGKAVGALFCLEPGVRFRSRAAHICTHRYGLGEPQVLMGRLGDRNPHGHAISRPPAVRCKWSARQAPKRKVASSMRARSPVGLRCSARQSSGRQYREGGPKVSYHPCPTDWRSGRTGLDLGPGGSTFASCIPTPLATCHATDSMETALATSGCREFDFLRGT